MTGRLKLTEWYFPNLFADGYAKNSPKCKRYNCTAFAAGDVDHVWDGYGDPPDGYWPTEHTGGLIEHLICAYEAEWFEKCEGPEPEHGYEKIVLYHNEKNGKWTHAARLRSDGWWESKLGALDDIIHRTPQALVGVVYGQVAVFMRRRQSDRLRFHLIRWLKKLKKSGVNVPFDPDERIRQLLKNRPIH